MATLIVVSNSEGVVGRCDSRCYEAQAPECDCICDGRNHGVGLERALESTAQLLDPTGQLREQVCRLGGDQVVVQAELPLPGAGR